MTQAGRDGATAVTCRGCGAAKAQLVLDLGDIPASDLFPSIDSNPAEDPAWALELYLCLECWLVQLGPSRQPEPEMPRAVESATALAHATASAAAIVLAEGLRPGQAVIEIDSHHGGSWLAGFTAAGLVEQPPDGTADLVADVHGLAHEGDLAAPLAEHARRLRPGGKLVLEFHHLLPMIEQGQIDTVRHGHFVYLSLLTMTQLLDRHGLVATRAVRVPIFGGSLRLTAARVADDPVIDPSVAEVRAAERAGGLEDPDTYRDFGERGSQTAAALRTHLEQARADGRTVAGYGAPSKAPVLLALAGVDESLLPYTADLAPAKHDRRLPGTAIPIVSPDELAERRPDEVVILTWDLADEVATQLRRMSVGGWDPLFWVPLPTPGGLGPTAGAGES